MKHKWNIKRWPIISEFWQDVIPKEWGNIFLSSIGGHEIYQVTQLVPFLHGYVIIPLSEIQGCQQEKSRGGHTVKVKNICCDICCDFLWFVVKFAVKAPQWGGQGPFGLYILMPLVKLDCSPRRSSGSAVVPVIGSPVFIFFVFTTINGHGKSIKKPIKMLLS